MRNKIITSFFCLLLAVSALIGLLMPDRYYSEREKRTLTQKPKFTVANFISGEFSDELEKYLTDQVPLRDGWVTMKTYMELAIGKRESVGVYICKDKYLMDKFTSYSKKQLVANAAALVDLQEKLAAEGISMNTILVPMAAQVLTDKLPAYNLALLLRVGNAFKVFEELLACINADNVESDSLICLHNLLELVLAQHSVVNEDTCKVLSDGTVKQCSTN